LNPFRRAWWPSQRLWPSVPQPLWTSFLSYGEHGEIKKIREEANIQGNGKMTKPGYKEEPSLKISFSRLKMNPNIKILLDLQILINFYWLTSQVKRLFNLKFFRTVKCQPDKSTYLFLNFRNMHDGKVKNAPT
jgi:hypothetical protein